MTTALTIIASVLFLAYAIIAILLPIIIYSSYRLLIKIEKNTARLKDYAHAEYERTSNQ